MKWHNISSMIQGLIERLNEMEKGTKTKRTVWKMLKKQEQLYLLYSMACKSRSLVSSEQLKAGVFDKAKVLPLMVQKCKESAVSSL